MIEKAFSPLKYGYKRLCVSVFVFANAEMFYLVKKKYRADIMSDIGIICCVIYLFSIHLYLLIIKLLLLLLLLFTFPLMVTPALLDTI